MYISKQRYNLTPDINCLQDTTFHFNALQFDELPHMSNQNILECFDGLIK